MSSSFLDDTCPWCGAIVGSEGYVFVKGHYECVRCKRPVLDCCDGEQNVSHETDTDGV